MSVSIAILAGGQSTRMGFDKAFASVAGQPLIERVLARVADLGSEILLVANSPGEYAHLGVPIHQDVIPGKKALGGIYTALKQASNEHTLIVACDLPFLSRALMAHLIALCEDYDVVVPMNRQGRPEGMQAVYGKGCLEPIRRRLERDDLKVAGFYPEVRVRRVGDGEIDRFDPNRCSFVNVNTPEELAAAHTMAAEGICV
jgi:molybdopterin-guanine dinucleotide biosynthesis protein A